MGISVGYASSQAHKINSYASTLRDVKNSMNNMKSNLGYNWQAVEINYVNRAIDLITKDLSNLESSLNLLNSDIVSTANEIKREEDARLAAEVAARVAAAKKAK